VERNLFENKNEIERDEAYNHDFGTLMAERIIHTIEEQIRFGTLYILNHTNFNKIGFSKTQILLWYLAKLIIYGDSYSNGQLLL
jgi:hypothetical protein